MTIVVVPIYQAEASPRILRGMFGSTIQAMVIFGQVISTLITYGTQHMRSPSGWRIPIGLQFAAPVLILALLPFLPESPRWLLIRGRREEAARSLARFRKGNSAESIDSELEGIILAHARENQGSWSEVSIKRTDRGPSWLHWLCLGSKLPDKHSSRNMALSSIRAKDSQTRPFYSTLSTVLSAW